MADARSPAGVGYTARQRAAMRAVEEEAILDLTRELVSRLNIIGDRLEAYAGVKNFRRPEERT